MTRASSVAALLGAALAVGCGASAAPPVPLTAEWPTSPARYDDALAAWTRSDKLMVGFDPVLEVDATFMAPAWRAAYVRERAEREMMTEVARAELAAREQSEAAEHYEIMLLVSTHQLDENDLQKGERSMWRVALVDDQDRELRPVSIERDRRKRKVLEVYFPMLSDFDTAYRVKFANNGELLGGGAQAFSLRVASARGGVELRWRAP